MFKKGLSDASMRKIAQDYNDVTIVVVSLQKMPNGAEQFAWQEFFEADTLDDAERQANDHLMKYFGVSLQEIDRSGVITDSWSQEYYETIKIVWAAEIITISGGE